MDDGARNAGAVALAEDEPVRFDRSTALLAVVCARKAVRVERTLTGAQSVVFPVNELDLGKREMLYHDIQKDLQTTSPYVVMFQQTEQSVLRKEVEGYISGATFDLIFYRNITK